MLMISFCRWVALFFICYRCLVAHVCAFEVCDLSCGVMFY